MTPEERKAQQRLKAHRESVSKSMAARRAAQARLEAMYAEVFEEIYEEEKAKRGIVSMKRRAEARGERMAARHLGLTLDELTALRAAVAAGEEAPSTAGQDDPDPLAKR